MFATIAVNSFAPFVKFNMADVKRRFQLQGCFLILWGAFQRKQRREKQRNRHRFWVQEIFQKRTFRYFAVGNALHPGTFADAAITISYPESSGFLVSGWAPVKTLEYWNFVTAKWKSLQGSQSKKLILFEFPRVSTGMHPLTKKPDDSGYEIATIAGEWFPYNRYDR